MKTLQINCFTSFRVRGLHLVFVFSEVRKKSGTRSLSIGRRLGTTEPQVKLSWSSETYLAGEDLDKKSG